MHLVGTAIRYLKIAAVPILISVTVMLNGCRGQSEESSETGETLRFVFLANSRGNALTDPINTPVLNAIIAQIKALSLQSAFMVFGGDMAYPGYIKPAYTFQTWKGLFAPLTSAGITLYTAIGNHELYHEHAGLFLLENQIQFLIIYGNENGGHG